MYIRTRLTLWFLLMMVGVLAIFSIVISQLTRSNLLTEIDRDVRQRAVVIAMAVRPDPRETTLHRPNLDVFTSPDVYLQVLDQNGAVLESSGNLGNRVLPLHRQIIAANRVEE